MSNPDSAASGSSAEVIGARFILVVDDEKRIADTLALILSAKGYASKAAYDGAEALALCDERVPDLVISDVVMPVMNGIDLAIAVRRSFSTCKALLFSGQAATADMLEQASSQGYRFELLAKPLHPADLLATVAELIGRPADSLQHQS
ncbi:MAG: response regulator [Terriglobales bacterium]